MYTNRNRQTGYKHRHRQGIDMDTNRNRQTGYRHGHKQERAQGKNVHMHAAVYVTVQLAECL